MILIILSIYFSWGPNLYDVIDPQQSHCARGDANNIEKVVFMFHVFYKTIPYALQNGFKRKKNMMMIHILKLPKES